MNFNIDPEMVEKAITIFEKFTAAANKAGDKLDALSEKYKQKNEEVKKAVIKTHKDEVEFLKLPDLVSLAQAHMPDGADSVIAAKSAYKENPVIYLSYAVGKEQLPNDKNILIIIIAEGISKEIKDLFGENQVIILK